MESTDIFDNLVKEKILTELEKKNIIDGIKKIEFAKGESILKQNIHSPYVFILEQGLVKEVIEGHKNRNLISGILVSGDFIGFSSIFTKEEQNFSVIALKHTRVICIEKIKIEAISNTNINFLKYLLSKIQNNSIHLIRKLNILGNKQIHGRFASVLLYLFSSKFESEEILKYLSRKELAELAGISLDSAMKVINELKNDKIIELSAKDILIKDMEMVERLAIIG